MVNAIAGKAAGLSAGLNGIGQSIASIFILLIIFQAIASILDGGKFQVKMLGPIVIYLLVCNFSLVSVPTKSFFDALQSSTSGQLAAANQNLFGNKTKWQTFVDTYKSSRSGQADIARLERELDDSDDALGTDGAGGLSSVGGAGNVSGGGSTGGRVSDETPQTGGGADVSSAKKFKLLGNIGDSVSSTLKKFWYWIERQALKGFTRSTDDLGYIIAAVGLPFLLSVLVEWFVNLITILMTALGAIMVGIFIVFGPITWAFALIPGNTGIIKGWFIRICQFALYSPLCQLVNYFSSTIFLTMTGMNAQAMTIGQGSMSLLGLLAVLLCNLVLLTTIPSIASQIIEGAAGGGLSLSNGVQTLMSPVRYVSEMSMAGERKRDIDLARMNKEQLDTLKEISRKLP